jgi:hypothetical protein
MKGMVQHELTERVKTCLSSFNFEPLIFIPKFKENSLFKIAKNWFQQLEMKNVAYPDLWGNCCK